MTPVTRIAPSPTGFLHVGTARVALYNWLFARKERGKFILRIEDTDLKRSSTEMAESIIESLNWLGLNWDGEICFQSKRFAIYEEYAKKLVDNKSAYYCYCTQKEIESRRRRAMAKKINWRYDRKCIYLSEDELGKIKYRPRTIRFFVPHSSSDIAYPPQKVSFEDGLHGRLERTYQEIEDFVLLKSDCTPSYNFACVVDDHELGITHVIRGEDHVANTFKQVLLYKAFGWEPPKFIHLPMILGPDRSKLSKRHGAVSILEYKQQGILPEALVNFLALLGWSPGGDREILSQSELIELFSLDRLSRTASVFDIDKLLWMNREYINRMSDDELLDRILSLTEYRIPNIENRKYMLKVVSLLKPRMHRLVDFMEFGDYFFNDPKEYEKDGIEKYFIAPEVKARLLLIKNRFDGLKDFNLESIESVIRGVAGELGIKAALLIHPIRLALTGKTGGPSLFHIVETLGKERVVRRLEKAILFLKT